jgi:hypothetical protein
MKCLEKIKSFIKNFGMRISIMRNQQVGKPDKLLEIKYKRHDLEKELLQLSEATRSKLLANVIINKGIKVFGFKDGVFSALLVAGLIFILIFLFEFMVSKEFYLKNIEFLWASGLASFLASFSLATIKILHDIILPPNAKRMMGYLNVNGIVAFRNWFQSYLSIKKQTFFSLFFGIGALITVYIVGFISFTKFDVGDYILAFLSAFSISHGGYSALLIPTLSKVISKEGIKMFAMDPANSPGIKIASWGFSLLSLADSFFVTLCIIAMYWLKPWESTKIATISGIWLIIGLLAVMYSFLYPHYYLGMAIKKEKENQLEKIQNTIASYYIKSYSLDEGDFKILAENLKIYDRILSTRESAIDTRALKNFVSSLALPSLSFITGLIDFGTILNSLF